MATLFKAAVCPAPLSPYVTTTNKLVFTTANELLEEAAYAEHERICKKYNIDPQTHHELNETVCVPRILDALRNPQNSNALELNIIETEIIAATHMAYNAKLTMHTIHSSHFNSEEMRDFVENRLDHDFVEQLIYCKNGTSKYGNDISLSALLDDIPALKALLPKNHVMTNTYDADNYHAHADWDTVEAAREILVDTVMKFADNSHYDVINRINPITDMGRTVSSAPLLVTGFLVPDFAITLDQYFMPIPTNSAGDCDNTNTSAESPEKIDLDYLAQVYAIEIINALELFH